MSSIKPNRLTGRQIVRHENVGLVRLVGFGFAFPREDTAKSVRNELYVLRPARKVVVAELSEYFRDRLARSPYSLHGVHPLRDEILCGTAEFLIVKKHRVYAKDLGFLLTDRPRSVFVKLRELGLRLLDCRRQPRKLLFGGKRSARPALPRLTVDKKVQLALRGSAGYALSLYFHGFMCYHHLCLSVIRYYRGRRASGPRLRSPRPFR